MLVNMAIDLSGKTLTKGHEREDIIKEFSKITGGVFIYSSEKDSGSRKGSNGSRLETDKGTSRKLTTPPPSSEVSEVSAPDPLLGSKDHVR